MERPSTPSTTPFGLSPSKPWCPAHKPFDKLRANGGGTPPQDPTRSIREIIPSQVLGAACHAGLAALALAAALAQAAEAPATPVYTLRPHWLLTGADQRPQLDLSGPWTYSRDLYRTGLTDINGWVAKSRMQRYRDVDVAATEAQGGTGFFEFDLDRGPVMPLPGAWNAAEPELRYYDGLIWFQRKFTPPATDGQRAFLRFGAVNYRAHVYLNGREVGQHEGGFTPFAFEVTGMLRPGENRLSVGVDSRHDAHSIPTDITDWDLYGGITRPVALVFTPPTFIDDATLALHTDGRLRGEVQLQGPEAARRPVHLRIAALGLQADATTDAQGRARFDLPAPAHLQRWSPEHPTLYDVRFQTAGDQVQDRIGLRTLEVRGADILLNGEPVFLRGVSLHEEELGANPARRMDDAAARALLGTVKHDLHGNYVRLSHYPHAETMLRAADELGLLVWAEIPVYWTADWDNPAVLDKARRMLAETIYRDRNRAAVALWSIGNETPVAEPRNRFHAALAQTVRALDPTRLVTAALLVERTGDLLRIADPLRDLLDVLAVNTYAGWYGDDTLEAVRRLRWEVPANKPLLLSEFGADALAGYRDPVQRRKFSEDYQADSYRATLAMAAQIPTLRGLSPWVLKDFRSPRREHPVYQNGWNRKGLLSETGQRKLAFDVLAGHYQQDRRGQAPALPNPLVPQRADPHVLQHDGWYYLMATVPEYDRLELRRARSVAGLAGAEPQVIWRRPAQGPMSWHIWAPELHRVDGRWVVYFSASEAGDIWKLRLYALENRSPDPMQGPWAELGNIKTQWESFTLDATRFEHRGQAYLVWAQHDPARRDNTQLYIARMADATTLDGPQVMISQPEHAWERQRHAVNEGPAVLVRGGRVFISYSASGTGAEYCLGLLWADDGADLLDPRAWHKQPEPVFRSSAAHGIYGPGHNSFVTLPDGEVLNIYHARNYRDIVGDPLKDRHRATRVQPLRFTADGLPDFGVPQPETSPPAPSP